MHFIVCDLGQRQLVESAALLIRVRAGMTNISFVLTFALTALIIYRNNLVKMIIGQELLSVGLNLWLISAGITISDANILSATLFLWIIGAVDVAVGLPLVMAITSSKRLGANKLSCVNNLRA